MYAFLKHHSLVYSSIGLFNRDLFRQLLPYIHMQKSLKDEILQDFAGVLDQIEEKPADEIESTLQNIVHRIRPLIYHV